MNELELTATRERLQARRRDLLARYHHARELAEEELDSREIEEQENAAELWDARVLSSMGEQDRRTLDAVMAALRRIEAGRYGRCTSCDEEIARERLEALPETALCLGCAIQR
jgi:RNA polymerase-binding transcription factor DksA